jgi:hypothetical protein
MENSKHINIRRQISYVVQKIDNKTVASEGALEAALHKAHLCKP